jgi:hypothetical protein
LGHAEQVHNWQQVDTKIKIKASSEALHQYATALTHGKVERFATNRETRQTKKMPYHVSLTTQAGQTRSFAVSGCLGPTGEHLLQLSKPIQSEAYIISNQTFRSLIPRGASLFQQAPTLATNAQKATMITYERDGHRCVLRRKGDKWAIMQPKVPYPIYTPPAMGPGEKTEPTTTTYIKVLDTFSTQELFQANSAAQQALMRSNLSSPTAKVVMHLANNKLVTILISPPVAGTEMAFLSVNGQPAVVNQNYAKAIAPDIASFFDPKALKSQPIQW